jgi:ketosteroid isomerase-like protein
MSAPDQTLMTIRSFDEAFNRHDVDAVIKLMTEDVVFENTSGGHFEGHEVVRRVLTRAFELMSAGWFETEDMFATGDRGVVRWTYRFHKEEPERGHIRGVDLFRVRNELVAEKLSYVKSEDFVRQLGLEIPHSSNTET